jgi:hypothetical protein
MSPSKSPATEHGQELVEAVIDDIRTFELVGRTPIAAVFSHEDYEELCQAAERGEIRFQLYPSGTVSVAIVRKPVKIEE